jgi:hypothetical protein
MRTSSLRIPWVLLWPEPEQAIEHQQVDGGIHTADQSEAKSL